MGDKNPKAKRKMMAQKQHKADEHKREHERIAEERRHAWEHRHEHELGPDIGHA
ncbi:MAG: hypothetical protein QM755_09550 [Luteolibacter sp.]